MPDSADPATAAFHRIFQKTQSLAKEVLGRWAPVVDRDARFPSESLEALKQARLLSAYVPAEYGGMGLSAVQMGKLCETLGQHCASTAMIYAMHQIQVACVVHHAQQSAYYRRYLTELVERQRLMASATTEVGVGGDLRSSICAIEVSGDSFTLVKKAPVISYGQQADDILVTCRRTPDSAPGDQIHVLVQKGEFTTEPISDWDTMGFRGTCSLGFTLTSRGHTDQIIPVPFSDILAQTMHPFAHVVWSSLWLGIATEAVTKARAFVRAEARKSPGETPLCALRLAEVDTELQLMRHNVVAFSQEYQDLLDSKDPEAMSGYGFSIRTNNLKLSSSRQVVDIVSGALMICGIAGYRNDSKYSLARNLRDAYGAALMVNNDRILKLNATMQMVHKDA